MRRSALAIVLLFAIAVSACDDGVPRSADENTGEDDREEATLVQQMGELGLRALGYFAENGDAEGQFALGVMYFTGGAAVRKDMAEAARWFRLAAEQGHAKAQSLLGGMYWDGSGVPKDRGEAERWYRMAIDKGHLGAANNFAYRLANAGRKLGEAEQLARRAVAEKPDNPYRVDTLGWVYFKKGDFALATKTLERAVVLDPTLGESHAHLGDALLASGDVNGAVAAWRCAVAGELPEATRREIERKIPIHSP